MISAIDSLLVYLQTELASSTIPIHWVRRDPNDATAHLLKEDTLNVSVLSVDEDGSSEHILVSLDIVGSDERTTFGWAKSIRDVLLQEQYTRELDYDASPTSPLSTGRLVSWDRDDVSFVVIAKNERYLHINSTFQITHVRA